MWTRAGLKNKASYHFTLNYWPCVAVGFVLFILEYPFPRMFDESILQNGLRFFIDLLVAIGIPDAIGIPIDIPLDIPDGVPVGIVIGILCVILGILGIVMLGLHLFVHNPLVVGSNRFFMENRESKAGLERFLYAYKSGHLLHLSWTMFLVNLYTCLWTLLLIIPGIVKSYEYAMVSYILSERPNLSTDRAFALSKELMDGEKWSAFVLDLSFIGWYLLSSVTYGLFAIFYVRPYHLATWAELYGRLREKAFAIPSSDGDEYPNYTAQ